MSRSSPQTISNSSTFGNSESSKQQIPFIQKQQQCQQKTQEMQTPRQTYHLQKKRQHVPDIKEALADSPLWYKGQVFIQPQDQWKVPYKEPKKAQPKKKPRNPNYFRPYEYNYYQHYYYNYYYNSANPLYPALCHLYQKPYERFKFVNDHLKVGSDVQEGVINNRNANMKWGSKDIEKLPNIKEIESIAKAYSAEPIQVGKIINASPRRISQMERVLTTNDCTKKPDKNTIFVKRKSKKAKKY